MQLREKRISKYLSVAPWCGKNLCWTIGIIADLVGGTLASKERLKKELF